jgi:hypothetical protein
MHLEPDAGAYPPVIDRAIFWYYSGLAFARFAFVGRFALSLRI